MDSYYNEIADGYDALYKAEQLHKLEALWQTMSDLGIRGNTLLDVGCGTGIASDFFAKKGFAVIGVDPSEKLLEKNIHPNFQGHAESLPFDNMTFDIVVSLTAIHNFNDVKKGLAEIKRVGKGIYVLTVLTKSAKLEEIDALIYELFDVALVYQEAQDTFYFCKNS
jgi:ubiquinone/menaquinone biosynthesis C-methylase UbiE